MEMDVWSDGMCRKNVFQVENHLQKLPGQRDWRDPLFITMTTATINATFPFIVDKINPPLVSVVAHLVGSLSSRFKGAILMTPTRIPTIRVDLFLPGCV